MAALEQSRAQQQTTPQALVGNMLARVADFVQGARQSDDLTLLAMRYTPQDEEVLLSRQLTLKNDLSLVKELNSFVKSVNQEMGLDKSLGMKLMLAVEEAVVNVMDYAYPNGMEGEVRIDVKVTPDRMNYTITDRGMAFEPTEVSKVDTSLSVEDRPIGGLGIFLVRNLMDSINYERNDGKNILTLMKNINSTISN